MKKILILLATLLVTFGVCAGSAFAETLYIGGDGKPLRLWYTTAGGIGYPSAVNGVCAPQLWDGKKYANQYYPEQSNPSNGADILFCFRFEYEGTTYQYGSNYTQVNQDGSFTNATILTNTTEGYSVTRTDNTITLKWTAVPIGKTGKSFDFETVYTYVDGNSYQKDYKFTPRDTDVTNLIIASGGDTYFIGDDKGYDYAIGTPGTEGFKMTYVKKENNVDASLMAMSSETAYHYFSGYYRNGISWATAFSETSESMKSSYVDESYYLQWRPGNVSALQTVTIPITETFDQTGQTVRMMGTQPSPAEAYKETSQQISCHFTAINMDPLTDKTVTNLRVESGDSSVTPDALRQTDYVLPSGATQKIPLTMTVAANTAPKLVPITLYYTLEEKEYSQTIYLSVTGNTRKVNFELNGGNWVSGYNAPVNYQEGVALELPTAGNLEKTGQYFAGW